MRLWPTLAAQMPSPPHKGCTAAGLPPLCLPAPLLPAQPGTKCSLRIIRTQASALEYIIIIYTEACLLCCLSTDWRHLPPPLRLPLLLLALPIGRRQLLAPSVEQWL